MRVLVAWDDSDQADLLSLYLGTEGSEIKICLTAEEFAAQNVLGRWDVVLMALTFPKTPEEGFFHFQKQQEMMPGVSVVIACRQNEMLNLPSHFGIESARTVLIMKSSVYIRYRNVTINRYRLQATVF